MTVPTKGQFEGVIEHLTHFHAKELLPESAALQLSAGTHTKRIKSDEAKDLLSELRPVTSEKNISHRRKRRWCSR